MKIIDFKNILNIKWQRLLIVLLLAISFIFFLSRNPLLILAAAAVLVEIILILGLFKNIKRPIKITTIKIAISFLISYISLLLLYNFAFFTNGLNQKIDINLFFSISKSFLLSIKISSIGIILLAAYLITILTYGKLLTKAILKNLYINLSRIEKYLYSLISGMMLVGFFVFFIAGYSLLNFISISLIFLPALWVFIYDYKKSLTLKSLQKIVTWNKTIDLRPIEIALTIITLLFLTAILIFAQQELPPGPDALRMYLNIIQDIANNGALPRTDGFQVVPFIAEVLMAPAFKIAGSAQANFIFKILSLNIVIPIYLIAKNLFNPKRVIYWALLPAIFFPPFLRILIGEFKIDVVLALVQLTFISLLLKYKENINPKFLYLGSIFLGYSILIKLTSVFLIPSYLLVLIFINYKNKINLLESAKQLVINFGITLLVPLIWFLFYRSNIPFFENIGFGLFPMAKDTFMPMQLSSCLQNIVTYEQESYYGLPTDSLKYLKALLIIAFPKNAAISISLGDPGIWISTTMLIALFYFLAKKPKLQFNSQMIIFIIAILFAIPIIYMTPIIVWYPALAFVLFFLISSIYLTKDNYWYIFKYFIAFSVVVYMNATILTEALSIYIAPEHSRQELTKDVYGGIYLQAENTSNVLNKSNEKILFSSFPSFSNISYYIDDYFNRAVYFDMYTDKYSEEDFLKMNENYNFKYFVFNKVSSFVEIQCLNDINNKIAKEIFMKYGTRIDDNQFYTVYTNNAWLER